MKLKPIPKSARAQARMVNKIEGLYKGATAEEIEMAFRLTDAVAAAFKINGHKSLYAAANKRVDKIVKKWKASKK